MVEANTRSSTLSKKMAFPSKKQFTQSEILFIGDGKVPSDSIYDLVHTHFV
jgi:hypothetical protein